MKKLNVLDIISLVLVIIGGLNWGLVGLFSFDLVQAVLGSIPALATLVYILVGLSAVYLIFIFAKLGKK